VKNSRNNQSASEHVDFINQNRKPGEYLYDQTTIKQFAHGRDSLFGHKILSVQVPGHIMTWFTAEEQPIKARMNDCSSQNEQDKHNKSFHALQFAITSSKINQQEAFPRLDPILVQSSTSLSTLREKLNWK
jgi:hypothetical protein